MGALAVDCANNPLGVVRSAFEDAVARGRDPTTLGNTDWGVADIFRRFLFEQDGLSKVPLLDTANLHLVQPNSLVKFRGMVQDMFDNEFYVGAFKDGSTWRTNKFMDVSTFSMTSASDMQIWDRRLLYCVPIPGQNTWVGESSLRTDSPMCCTRDPSIQREKRERESYCDFDPCHPETSEISRAKKLCENGSCSQQQEQVKDTAVNGRMDLHLETNFFPCLVKMYDEPNCDLKLNDVYEFIGIFTFNPELVSYTNGNDDFADDLCENVSTQFPPSKVPRIHCIISRKLMVQDFISAPIENTSNVIRNMRDSLLGYFTSILGGDGLSANFLLLHLMSQVHARVESVAVGKLSLNLTGFTKESADIFGNNLKSAIQNLLPFSQIMQLTVEYLNTASLGPKKNYNINRLMTGSLQLARGTHLTIDETGLLPGPLNAVGVNNAKLLKDLLELQKVEYDFQYYKLEMEADVQVLVISAGKSNIVPADLVIPFHPTEAASCSNVTSTELQAWRSYLTTMRSLPHAIDPAIQKTIEDDMVAARQAERTLGPDDFSRLGIVIVTVVDDGSLDVNKLWRTESNFGTVADGNGDGKAKKRKDTVD
ncbi:Mini-chromosome maintenance complex-binding protein [Nymphaea thermarum]|nr:Mini-chromosome maintenance complex-binding protein [Nymphaea thermarum]